MKNCIFFLLFFVVLVAGCSKQTATSTLTPANELYPMQVGRTFTYRMDSTVTVNFATALVVHSYLIKDSVESSFLDLQGRKSFRIFRYITDTLASKPYQYSTTYYTTVDTNKIEVVNNNLRFIPLVNPVSENTSWQGNKYLNLTNITTNNNNLSYSGWNYTYTNIDQPYRVKKGLFQNTTTVLQIADSSGPVFDPSFVYSKIYSTEVYAKGVGLIYKNFIAFFYQSGFRTYDEGSFGIKLNLVDYK